MNTRVDRGLATTRSGKGYTEGDKVTDTITNNKTVHIVDTLSKNRVRIKDDDGKIMYRDIDD